MKSRHHLPLTLSKIIKLNLNKNNSEIQISPEQKLLNILIPQLIDPQARDLAKQIRWFELKNLSSKGTDRFPIAIAGKGPPLLLLHGFDSSFLEFRRIFPLLINHHKVIIPDLFGFGFCPRPPFANHGPEALLNHLQEVLESLSLVSNIGVIGASMGGAIAMELARRNPRKINRLLLLSPAGLTGKPMPVPHILDKIGVWFLSRPEVRKALCRQAFADPKSSVGPPEEQIASLHLQVPGWGRSLAAFARSGGIANYGLPLPPQPLNVIWGDKDRILTQKQRDNAISILNTNTKQLDDCGHLPHLEKPEFIAEYWLRIK